MIAQIAQVEKLIAVTFQYDMCHISLCKMVILYTVSRRQNMLSLPSMILHDGQNIGGPG
jgi:hypothetical protein